MTEDWITVIPAIKIHKADRPELYACLSRMGRTQVQVLVLDALERSLLADTRDRDYTLATILHDVQAIRSRLEGQPTTDQNLPSDVEDALANLGKE